MSLVRILTELLVVASMTTIITMRDVFELVFRSMSYVRIIYYSKGVLSLIKIINVT
jgi:hypothetical protein